MVRIFQSRIPCLVASSQYFAPSRPGVQTVPTPLLVRMLHITEGHRTHAALLFQGLGYKIQPMTIVDRILSSRVGSELASFATKKGSKYRKSADTPKTRPDAIPTDQEIAAALRVTGGHRREAAKILHRNRRFIEQLVSNAPEASLLAAFREGSRPGKKIIKDADLVGALEAARGSRELASLLLRGTGREITPQAIGVRVKASNAPPELARFSGINGRRSPLRPGLFIFIP